MLCLLTVFLLSSEIRPAPGNKADEGHCPPALRLRSRVAIIKLPYENATIWCNYTCSGKVKKFSWRRDNVTGPYVVGMNSRGKTERADEYDGLVDLREGCSLVFKSPSLNDNGTYVILIENDVDEHENIQVIVVDENATIYSNVNCSDCVSHSDDSGSCTGSDCVSHSDDSGSCTGLKVAFGIVVAVLVIAIIVIIWIRRKNKYCPCVKDEQNNGNSQDPDGHPLNE